MLAGAKIPVEEYLRTSYDPDREYVDGQLLERSVGERLHARLQALLAVLLGSRERDRGFEVFTEQRIRIDARRYRIPDVCVKSVPYDAVPVLTSPEVIIEILSPDDTLAAVAEKSAEYASAGVQGIWVADPYRKALYTYGASGLELRTGLILEDGLIGRIDFAELFKELDRSGRRR
jgi:Uma2 family endonuclease